MRYKVLSVFNIEKRVDSTCKSPNNRAWKYVCGKIEFTFDKTLCRVVDAFHSQLKLTIIEN